MTRLPETDYDVKHIESVAKRKFILSLLTYVLLLSVMTVGILSIVFFSEYPLAFLGGGAAIVISTVFITKKIKKVDLTTLKTSVGRISDIDVQIRTHRMIAGGIGLRDRQYDTYKKQTTTVGVFIDEGDRITPYYVHNATAKQVEYYRSNAEAIHIFATRFPIKTSELSEEWICSVCKTKNEGSRRACLSCRCHRNNEWLCPICGSFNESESISCRSCKTRIMKKASIQAADTEA
jgi:rubrerythrin